MDRRITHTGGELTPNYTSRDVRCIINAIHDAKRAGGGTVMLDVKEDGTVYVTPYKRLGRSVKVDGTF